MCGYFKHCSLICLSPPLAPSLPSSLPPIHPPIHPSLHTSLSPLPARTVPPYIHTSLPTYLHLSLPPALHTSLPTYLPLSLPPYMPSSPSLHPPPYILLPPSSSICSWKGQKIHCSNKSATLEETKSHKLEGLRMYDLMLWRISHSSGGTVLFLPGHWGVGGATLYTLQL